MVMVVWLQNYHKIKHKEIVVKEGNIQVTGTNKIKTGQALIVGEKTYTLEVTGDVNKDGKVDIKDILQLNKYRLGKINSL